MYSAFISYSHSADGKIAPALQRALHRFARPWYRLYAVRLFRDQTNLSLNPELWPTIQEALRQSEYFLLLASPQAAASKWVRREVSFWASKDADAPKRLFIVLTDGELVWDEEASDYDWTRTTALPGALSKIFREEPLYLDLRWARKDEDLSLRNPRFKEAVADIAAPLRGVSKDMLIGEDVRQYKKSRRLAWAAVVSLLILTAAASVAASLAVRQSRIALRERDTALSREVAGSALSQLSVDPELSLLLAVEAARLSPTAQAEDALRRSLAEPHVLTTIRGHEGYIYGAEFSPDGRFVLTTGLDMTARLWEAGTGRAVAVMRGHTSLINDACFSPDGRRIVTTSDDGTTRVWDAGTGDSIAVLPDRGEGAERIETGAGGKLVLRFYPGGSTSACEAGTGRFAAGRRGRAELESAVLSPDRRFKVTDDEVPRIIETESGRVIAELGEHTGQVYASRFSPDSRLLVTAARFDVTARVWESATGRAVAELRGHTDQVQDASFGPDSRTVVTASADGTAKVWDLDIWQKASALPERQVSTQGASSGQSNVPVAPVKGRDGPASDTASGQSVLLPCDREEEVELEEPSEFSPDGRFVVANCGKTARVFEVGTWRPVTEVRGRSNVFNSVRFSPDSKLLVTAEHDGVAWVWEVMTGRVVAELEGHTHHELLDATFSPDSNLVVTACADQTAMVWEANTGRRLAVLRGHTSAVTSASFSPDGRWVVTGSADGTVRLWEPRSGRNAVLLRGHLEDFGAIRFSRDGKYLISEGGAEAQAYACEVCGPLESLVRIARARITRQLTREEREGYLHEQQPENP